MLSRKGHQLFTCSHPAHAGRSYPAAYAPAHAIYAHAEAVEMVEASA